MTMVKQTLIALAISLAFAGCTTEPDTNRAKPAESVSATPVPSATQAAATPSPASTSTATPAASPAKPNEKDNEK